MPPPLSLLQGFNITSHDGLNNLIAIANEQFGHNHAESFTRDEFDEIQALGGIGETVTAGNLTVLIDEITLRLESKDLRLKEDKLMPAVANVFKSHKAPYHLHKSRLLAAGCVGTLQRDLNLGIGVGDVAFRLTLDPLNLPSLFPILLAVLKRIANEHAVPKW